MDGASRRFPAMTEYRTANDVEAWFAGRMQEFAVA